MTHDFWDLIVGIPLDLWIAASTPDDVAALITRREAGEFPLVPLPPEPCRKCDPIAIEAFDGTVVQYLCICPVPELISTVWR